jgi:hypothetical protein
MQSADDNFRHRDCVFFKVSFPFDSIDLQESKNPIWNLRLKPGEKWMLQKFVDP